MLDIDLCTTPFLEFKALGDAATGEFEGYGAIFGNVDGHGDLILPGAFKKSLDRFAADGRQIAMHLEHAIPSLGGERDIGCWKSVTEDDKGLHVVGKIANMDHPDGRKIYGKLRDGALKGLSIGYAVRPNGAKYSRIPGEPKRTLIDLHVEEISVVGNPSNTKATATKFKTLMQHADADTATKACVAAMMLHRSCMSGGDAPNKDERAQLGLHLGDIHEALTGSREPKGMKAADTIREFQDFLMRELQWSNSRARLVAESGFKALTPRDEGGDQAIKSAVEDGDILASIFLAKP